MLNATKVYFIAIIVVVAATAAAMVVGVIGESSVRTSLPAGPADMTIESVIIENKSASGDDLEEGHDANVKARFANQGGRAQTANGQVGIVLRIDVDRDGFFDGFFNTDNEDFPQRYTFPEGSADRGGVSAWPLYGLADGIYLAEACVNWQRDPWEPDSVNGVTNEADLGNNCQVLEFNVGPQHPDLKTCCLSAEDSESQPILTGAAGEDIQLKVGVENLGNTQAVSSNPAGVPGYLRVDHGNDGSFETTLPGDSNPFPRLVNLPLLAAGEEYRDTFASLGITGLNAGQYMFEFCAGWDAATWQPLAEISEQELDTSNNCNSLIFDIR